METRIVNSAAGTVISAHGKLTSRRVLVRYQINMAILNAMLRNGELSERDHATACAVLACHYGLDQDSIFR